MRVRLKKMAEKLEGDRAKATKKSTKALNGPWSDEETETLLDIFAEETIQHSLDTPKSPKDRNAVYGDVKVQLEVKGEIRLMTLLQRVNGLVSVPRGSQVPFLFLSDTLQNLYV